MANLFESVQQFWGKLQGKDKMPNPIDQYVMSLFAYNARYPNVNNQWYLDSYTGNSDVFTIINKITEPAATVPIIKYDQNGEMMDKGQMITLLNRPNNYMSRSQFIEAAISYYLVFGESFTAYETVDMGNNAGKPVRLDVLPPQFMQLVLGDVFDPIAGYCFYPMGAMEKPYERNQIFHWKEFNPDYKMHGGHLRGQSRLLPLLKTVTGSGEAYNSLVRAFQNQGAWGILTMLDENKDAVQLSREQKSQLKNRFKYDMDNGELYDLNGHYLICSMHGARYRPDNGLCIAGPCQGASLHPVPVHERDGMIYYTVTDSKNKGSLA